MRRFLIATGLSALSGTCTYLNTHNGGTTALVAVIVFAAFYLGWIIFMNGEI